MNTLLEIAGTWIIGSLLILSMMTLLFGTMDAQSELVSSVATHDRLLTVADIINADIRIAGIGVPDSIDTVIAADSTQFMFLGDIDNNGTPDTLSYFVRSVLGAYGDTLSFIMRRIGSNSGNEESMGKASVSFSYFNAEGSPTASLSDIRSVTTQMRAFDMISTQESKIRASLQWQTYLVNIDR